MTFDTRFSNQQKPIKIKSCKPTTIQYWCNMERRVRTTLLFVMIVTTFGSLWFQVTLYSQYEIRNLEIPFQQLMESVTVGQRSLVARDEFFVKPPPANVQDAYFAFQPPPEDQIGPLQRLWNCHSTPRANKLIYLHMAHSASSTLRAFFRAYANYCKAGLAIVTQCIDLATPNMMGDEIWTNGGHSKHIGEQCQLSHLENRSGYIFPTDLTSRVSTHLLEQNGVDILTGHIPIGSDFYWKNEQLESMDVQYVVFLREPFQKFVGRFLQTNRTIEQAAEAMAENVNNKLASGVYRETLSNYLITPEQKNWAFQEGVLLTDERRINLTLSNLSNKRLMVGIVDDMPASFELLQYLMDGNDQVPRVFQFFSNAERIDQASNGTIAFSQNRTNQLIAFVRNNATLQLILEDFLQHEIRIYNYGLWVHKKQVQWVRNQSLHSESRNNVGSSTLTRQRNA